MEGGCREELPSEPFGRCSSWAHGPGSCRTRTLSLWWKTARRIDSSWISTFPMPRCSPSAGGLDAQRRDAGPAKDANLRAVFIDRVTINATGWKPLGKRIEPSGLPRRSGEEPDGCGRPDGDRRTDRGSGGRAGTVRRLPAGHHAHDAALVSSGTGPILDSQDWVFAAATGERLEMHIKAERGVANRTNPTEVLFYSAKNPGFYQISRQEQVLDILRNTTTNPPDRGEGVLVQGIGRELRQAVRRHRKVLSWDNILWINRSVSLP